jgi:hypothetical protein
MSYQAVIRNTGGNLITNSIVGMQISILKGSTSGIEVYVETQSTTSNAQGLISIIIGNGVVQSGDIYTIDWSSGSYFVKTEIDPSGGADYTIVGISQLLSVPYALHANTASALTTNIPETDPVFASAIDITNSMIGDLLKFNGIQYAKFTPNYLTSEEDGSVTNEIELPAQSSHPGKFLTTDGTNPAWATALTSEIDGSVTNEIELPAQSGNSGRFLTTDGTNPAWTYALTSEIDGSVTNEIQTLSISGSKLYISGPGGNNVSLPVADGSETRVTVGDNLTITGNGTITSPYYVSSITYNIGDMYMGGIIFWLDETKQHGLICETSDISTGIRWYAGTIGNTRAYADGVTGGRINTSIIIAAQVAIGDDGATYAARICNEKSLLINSAFQSGWYLPSSEELQMMYRNRSTINTTALANGGSVFTNDLYWSSTEESNFWAKTVSFSYGGVTGQNKNALYRVRAIRAF